jgi:hypothetical protein
MPNKKLTNQVMRDKEFSDRWYAIRKKYFAICETIDEKYDPILAERKIAQNKALSEYHECVDALMKEYKKDV